VQRNGKQDKHIKEGVAKAASIMGVIWGKKEKIWKGLEEKNLIV